MFGFLVSITHNSKIVGSMTQKLVWISITLFPIFVSITQFSDFLVMSYGNWKHILTIFSFHNSAFNGIFVIKHTWRDPLVKSAAPFDLFFFSTFLSSPGFGQFVLSSFLFFFSSFSPKSCQLILPFFFFFLVLHHRIFSVFSSFFLFLFFFLLLSLGSGFLVFFIFFLLLSLGSSF